MIFLANLSLKFQLLRSPSSGSLSVFVIEGRVRYPGFYTYIGSYSLKDALKRAGGLIGNNKLSPGFFTAPLINGNMISVNNEIKFYLMEAEKFILFFIPFDVNHATLKQLMAIPGLGEKLSQNILDYRSNAGGFKSIEELKNISGIGESKFPKIKNYFSINYTGGNNGH